jgi:hypothetical protein
MDLRLYYQRIREVEAAITDEYAVVVSKETGDGGVEGRLTETPRRLAAKMIVEGQARLATKEEAAEYRASLAEAKRIVEQAAAAANLRVSVLSTSELDQLRAEARKNTKGQA